MHQEVSMAQNPFSVSAPHRSFVLQYLTRAVTTSPRIFDVDLSFALPPSQQVDAAWASLLPQGGGFFKHPTLAPKKSCVAVFHQLHCLDMLRQALYAASPELGGEPGHKSAHAHHEDENHEQSMYHIGHCFDLLRQTLMCRPDLTVEVGNETLGGVTGFGTEHQCVNWNSLMGWMAKYE